MKPAKPRAILSEDEAIQIFKAKALLPSAPELARAFQVTEKTVRDIWTGRTWSCETWHLDPSRPHKIKQPGRPKGRKDSQPRRRRFRVSFDHLAEPAPVELDADAFSQCQQEPDRNPKFKKHSKLLETAYEMVLAEGYAEAVPDNSNAWYRSDPRKSCNTELKPPLMLNHHGSIDAQLHEWGTFWSSSRSVDPFRSDWAPLRFEY
jgi:hypothetical protein